METWQARAQQASGISRRALLKAGLASGVTLSTWPLHRSPVLWGAEAGQPRRGGILRVRGFDPPHFDPHLTIAPATHFTLSLVYSRLVRHQVGPEVQPDRKSTRLNSSHGSISYAVFCLKKKKKNK